jgi:F0F1-type ATP synthase delta subunit
MARITRKELAEVIGEKTFTITDKTKLVSSIAAYIAGEPRAIDLDSLVRDVMQYRLERGYVEAVAVSAYELTPAVISDIEALLREHFPDAKAILIDSRIDASVVGGVRIELPQEELDLSVKSKLNLFKRLVSEERN